MYEELMDGDPFMDLVVAGRERASRINDYLAAWHDASPDTRAASVEVDEFLGMSWGEYAQWVESPSTLRFIVAARKAQQPVAKVMEQTKLAGAAARSDGHDETSKLLKLLKDDGDIDQTGD